MVRVGKGGPEGPPFFVAAPLMAKEVYGMPNKRQRRLQWQKPFLDALRAGQSVTGAAEAARIDRTTAYSRRQHCARFAGEWEAALGRQTSQAGPAAETARTGQWCNAFIEALAETSDIDAAAAAANVPKRTVSKRRRTDPKFAAKWLGALREGYDHLEMELLGYLRNPNPKRKMNVTAVLRLLAAHRETVERHRALTAQEDEQATVEALDAFFEGLRQRRLANQALVAETVDDHDDR